MRKRGKNTFFNGMEDSDSPRYTIFFEGVDPRIVNHVCTDEDFKKEIQNVLHKYVSIFGYEMKHDSYGNDASDDVVDIDINKEIRDSYEDE
jgi:hypothetical protein